MKIPTIVSSSKGLLDAVEYLLDHIHDDKFWNNPNKYAFILSASATLESLLNHGIVKWTFLTFPQEHYKRHAMAFLSMNLAKKLDALGYLLSGGKFITDNSSQHYQSLITLIKLRNEVAHSKDFYSDASFVHCGEEDGVDVYELPKSITDRFSKSPISIDFAKCESFAEALKHLSSVLEDEVKLSNSPLFKAL
ncbi:MULTISPECIES: hypothetical protein [Vibrio]|uniref:hypothetical protein n=1 Tax=Vibrio TaxID=662 RepID=UPI0002E7596A|nr:MULTISPECIES: hypothetical protein [Vibrio]OEE51943.1 hypothetical protein A146_21115 [Vibrio splendidus FF-500]TKF22154.1 hypothetical protein FCV43_07895 [Vibrio genomosp. F6]